MCTHNASAFQIFLFIHNPILSYHWPERKGEFRPCVTGSGSASLWVTDRFEGKTSTGGKIFYKGSPTVVRRDLKFMGGDVTHLDE